MVELSQYCKECIEFTSKTCDGKTGGVVTTLYYGTTKKDNPSGLHFCKRYKFDYRVSSLTKGDVSFIVEEALHDADITDVDTTKVAKKSAKETSKKRKAARQERRTAAENIDVADEIDVSESLSSSDFEDLII